MKRLLIYNDNFQMDNKAESHRISEKLLPRQFQLFPDPLVMAGSYLGMDNQLHPQFDHEEIKHPSK